MINDQKTIDEYYEMLINKSSQYEGIFFVGVKTTGVFCRPTCPAKKPLKINCEFFNSAQEAVLSGFRPCKRCNPLSSPSLFTPEVQKLIEAIEQDPTRKWTDADFDKLSVSANTARRQFKKQFGMTFIAYTRSRRLGIAFQQIRNGSKVIDGQLNAGYESGNGFTDAFSKTMGNLPMKSKEIKELKSTWIETPLGAMIAIADDDYLYLLEFTDRRGLENEIKKLREKHHYCIVPGNSEVFVKLRYELNNYFKGFNFEFTVPIKMIGSDFQKNVWLKLQEIPPGETISYKKLACSVSNANAARAVARANGANQISILIPCHRVINLNGELGGYGGGIHRKEWLLRLEKNNMIKADTNR